MWSAVAWRSWAFLSPATMGRIAFATPVPPRLVATGLRLKEIGDRLGYRSAYATRVYAKGDLTGLREVTDLTCGGSYETDVAPSFYPVLSSFPAWVVPCWAGEATGASAEPLA
ncbi:hypothetical protein [Mesorhizobium sp. M0571]|uniref:hypothetical protein n=1 Tax=Mesorhizobium sp. M0571 TaxID=2956960 RepID=UPI003334D09E